MAQDHDRPASPVDPRRNSRRLLEGADRAVAREAVDRGPIAALRDGDLITIDVETRRLEVALTPHEIAARLADWQPPPPRYTTGVLAKYARLVTDASQGAVTDA